MDADEEEYEGLDLYLKMMRWVKTRSRPHHPRIFRGQA
jgi:hypothetical protein